MSGGGETSPADQASWSKTNDLQRPSMHPRRASSNSQSFDVLDIASSRTSSTSSSASSDRLFSPTDRNGYSSSSSSTSKAPLVRTSSCGVLLSGPNHGLARSRSDLPAKPAVTAPPSHSLHKALGMTPVHSPSEPQPASAPPHARFSSTTSRSNPPSRSASPPITLPPLRIHKDNIDEAHAFGAAVAGVKRKHDLCLPGVAEIVGSKLP